VTGITMAVIMIAGATAEGAEADPVVSKAVASATVGPFLVGAMGFAASLTATGLLILRSHVFARWIAIVALLGGASFFIAFFTLLSGPSHDSIFGYGFFPGFLALTIWSILPVLRTTAGSGARRPAVWWRQKPTPSPDRRASDRTGVLGRLPVRCLYCISSRWTCPGCLSGRRPRQEGWRRWPSAVHSV